MLPNIPCIPSLIIQIIPAILRVRQEKVPQIKIPRISNIVFEIIYHENYFDISKVSKINKNNRNPLSFSSYRLIMHQSKIQYKKKNSIVNNSIHKISLSTIFPLVTDREPLARKDSHRAGIITKRRIKLHDILLLSRFPLIKQPAFPSVLVPVCARVNASRYHFSSLRHVPFRLAFRSLDEYTHIHTHIHCVSISIVHSTFLYTYISPPFHDLAALGCYIFNTTLAIRSGGNPRFLVRPTGLHDQPWHDGGRDERQEEGGERERERSGKKDRKKRNTLFEWIASLHSYA